MQLAHAGDPAGIDGSGLLYDDFIECWDRRSSVVVVHYPPDQPLDYRQLAEHAWDQLPPEGPLALIGESFSGPVSIILAARLGKRARGLILCCSFCKSPHAMLKRLPLALLPIPNRPERWISRLVLGPFATRALEDQLALALKPLTTAVIRARFAALSRIDQGALLAQLKIPILYLQASFDTLVWRQSAREVARLAPQTRFRRLKGAHFLLQSNPSDCVQAIAKFYSRLEFESRCGQPDGFPDPGNCHD